MCCHSARCGMTGLKRSVNALGYAQRRSRSNDAVIRVYDIETHEHAGDFKEW